MKQIPLTQGQFALVDDEYYDMLMKFKWYAQRTRNTDYFYARKTKDKKTRRENHISQESLRIKTTNTSYELMHRIIMNCPDNMQIDHINHDTLDNRKINLRVVSHTENMQNKLLYKTSKTKIMGVSWYKPYKKWIVQIQINKHKINLGYYNNIEDATLVYEETRTLLVPNSISRLNTRLSKKEIFQKRKNLIKKLKDRIPTTNTSGIKYVHWNKRTNRWVSVSVINGKNCFFFGNFKCIQDAEKAAKLGRAKILNGKEAMEAVANAKNKTKDH